MAEKQQRIRAVKNFWHNAKQVGIGSVLDVDISLARDLRGGNKAEWVQADTLLVEQAPPQRPPPEEPEGTKLLRVLVKMVENQGRQIEVLTAALTGQVQAQAKAAPKPSKTPDVPAEAAK